MMMGEPPLRPDLKGTQAVDIPGDAGEEDVDGRWTRYLSVFLAILLIGTLLGIGLAQDDEAPRIGVQAGQLAPDFTLTTFDGQIVRLADYRGQPVVLNFWASWCSPCREEAPVFRRVAATNAGRVGVLGVNARDRDADARRFLADFDVSYPNGPDDSGIEGRYGVVGLPTTVFIASDGTIDRIWLGPVKERELVAMIEEIE